MIDKLKPGMSREEVVAAIGKPDDMGRGSRKYPTPSIYLYRLPEIDLELWFEPWKAGKLVRLWDNKKHEGIPFQ